MNILRLPRSVLCVYPEIWIIRNITYTNAPRVVLRDLFHQSISVTLIRYLELSITLLPLFFYA